MLRTKLPRIFLAIVLCSIAILTVLPHQPLYAQSLTVTNLNDSGAGSLREAISTAASGATITFADGLTGTITLGSYLFIDKVLTIDGPGAATITISGNNTSRIFLVWSNVSFTVKNLTLTNGKAPASDLGGNSPGFTGAAIYNPFSDSILTVINATITNNSPGTYNGSQGGAILNGGTMTISGSTFSGNSAEAGGAIYNFGTQTVVNTTFNGNTGYQGGAIHTSNRTTIENSSYSNNTSSADGGSIYSTGLLNIKNSTFSSNTATLYGGAIYLDTVTEAAISKSAFLNNTASLGGAISNRDKLTISNSTFTGNSANDYGGAILNIGYQTTFGTIRIVNSTIYNNSGTNAGGITNTAGPVDIYNSIVAGGAGNPACETDLGAVFNGSNNLTDDGSCPASAGFTTSATINLGALTGSPAYFPLLSGSSAIDSADSTICAQPLPYAPNTTSASFGAGHVDQRGVTRPIDGDGNGSAICDIGAYEAPAPPPTNAPTFTHTPSRTPTRTLTPTPTLQPALTVNTLSDVDDGVCNITHCSLREAIAQTPSNGTIIFASGLSGTIVLSSQLVIQRPLTIQGSVAITISGNNAVPVLTVNPGINFTLSDLTLSDSGYYALYQFGEAFGETIQITNVTFANNSEGAIYALNISNLMVSDSTFQNNIGGAIHAESVGNVTVSNSTFQNNTGDGAIYTRNVGSLTVSGSTFQSNSARNGGAIYSEESALTVENSSFIGNTGGDGGAISTRYANAVAIQSSVFYNNSAYEGGAIYLFASLGSPHHADITNTTFHANSATDRAGAIFSYMEVHIINSTLHQNQPSNLHSFRDIILGNTILSQTSPYRNCERPTEIIDMGGNLQYPYDYDSFCEGFTYSPLIADPQLGPLQSNGGTTDTLMPAVGSPAIDGGYGVECPPTDQRGVTRPVNEICDIGAVEVEGPLYTSTPTLTFTSTPSPTATNTPLVSATPSRTPSRTPTNTPLPIDLSISLSVSSAQFTPGQTITFSIVITNTTATTVSGVSVAWYDLSNALENVTWCANCASANPLPIMGLTVPRQQGSFNGVKEVFVTGTVKQTFTPSSFNVTATLNDIDQSFASVALTKLVPTDTPTLTTMLSNTPSQTPLPTLTFTPSNTPTATAISLLPTNTLFLKSRTQVPLVNGLRGFYFNNADLTSLVLNRVDSTVNFNWLTGSPEASIGVDTFSVRWTGSVVPQYSQPYRFYVEADGGVRLWINGVMVINNWVDANTTRTSTAVTLTAGTRYPIQVDYFENTGNAKVILYWSSASQPKQVIPTTRLFTRP